MGRIRDLNDLVKVNAVNSSSTMDFSIETISRYAAVVFPDEYPAVCISL